MGQWNLYNTDKFIDEEILSKSKIESIEFNSDDVQLPSGSGLCYVGKGIQLEYNGVRYNISDQSAWQNVVESWDDVKWYWNRKAFLKYGGGATTSFDVYVMDKNGQLVPDIQLNNVTKNVL